MPSTAERDRAPLRWWLLGLLVVCAVSFWLRVEQVEGSMPYPRHVDEGAVVKHAARIVATGDFHPGRFTYPSLPTYMAAAAMGVGFVRAAANLEIEKVNEIGRVSYPYYDVPIVVETARQVFALLSIVALAATGAVAYLLLDRRGGLVLAPLVLTVSPFFFYMSWSYVNVDIAGTCFVALTLAAVLKGTHTPSMRWLAVMPGVLAGLSASCKYPYGFVVVAVFLGVWLYMERGRRLDALAIAAVATVAGFVLSSPYSLLDLPTFLNGLAFDAYNYAAGYTGDPGERGWAMLAFYRRHLVHDFGVVVMLVALAGLFFAAFADWRRTLIVVAFPVVLLALLAGQRLEFARNILPIYPVVAVLVAAGILGVSRLLAAQVINRWLPPPFQRPLAAAAVVLLFAVVLIKPLGKLPKQADVPPESRVLAVEWIEENVPPDRTIVMPVKLGLDARPLEARGHAVRMEEFLPLDTAAAIDALVASVGGPVVVLVPEWDIDRRAPGEELAAALNRAGSEARLETLKSFPGIGLKVNYPQPIAAGNPAIRIAVPRS